MTEASRPPGPGPSTASARSWPRPTSAATSSPDTGEAWVARQAAERVRGRVRSPDSPVVAALRCVEPDDRVDAWRAGVDRAPDVVDEAAGAYRIAPVGRGLGDHE